MRMGGGRRRRGDRWPCRRPRRVAAATTVDRARVPAERLPRRPRPPARAGVQPRRRAALRRALDRRPGRGRRSVAVAAAPLGQGRRLPVPRRDRRAAERRRAGGLPVRSGSAADRRATRRALFAPSPIAPELLAGARGLARVARREARLRRLAAAPRGGGRVARRRAPDPDAADRDLAARGAPRAPAAPGRVGPARCWW